MSELLVGHRRFRTFDIEEVLADIAQELDPLHYRPVPHRITPGVNVLNAAEVGSVNVCYVAHGVPGRVWSDGSSGMGNPYLKAVVLLSGRAVVRSDRDETTIERNEAFVFSSDVNVEGAYEAGTELISIRFYRDDLHTQLGRMLGRPPTCRLNTPARLDAAEPAVRSWLSTVRMFCHDLDGPRGLSHAALQRQAGQLLMSQLLTVIPSTGNDDLAALTTANPCPVMPRTIRRAEQLIADHAHEALTVADIAEAVGISVRSLQEGFRRHLDTTPTARLLQARLSGVRAELLAADPLGATVTQIAYQWGFFHLGRFASIYRQFFNESPSHTLRH